MSGNEERPVDEYNADEYEVLYRRYIEQLRELEEFRRISRERVTELERNFVNLADSIVETLYATKDVCADVLESYNGETKRTVWQRIKRRFRDVRKF